MKKNINRFLIAGVMAVAMMSMAACGSKSEPAATTAAPAAAGETTAAPAEMQQLQKQPAISVSRQKRPLLW